MTDLEELKHRVSDALNRMENARLIITDGNPRPACNWGMLDATDAKIAFAELIERLERAERAQVKSDLDALNAKRYRYIRMTTKAIRDDDGNGRVEVTPEMVDAMTDAAMLDVAESEGGHCD